MITSAEMYRKASRVLAGYVAKIKAGSATLAERERAATITDHVLIYEWAEDGRPAVEVIAREEEPAPVWSARAVQFAAWWDRNQYGLMWGGDWVRGLVHWSRDTCTASEMLALASEVDDMWHVQAGAAPVFIDP